MNEFQAVCLAVFLLCIGFGGGWFARSQKAETPRIYTDFAGNDPHAHRYDPAEDRFVIYGHFTGGCSNYLFPLHVRARRLDDAHRSK